MSREWNISAEIIEEWKALIGTEGAYDVLFSWDEISERIAQLAEEINSAYEGVVTEDNPLVVVCVLTGALYTFGLLVKQLRVPLQFEFLDVSSYSGRSSTGVIKIERDLDIDIRGRHVLIVEDIVDTGLTLNYLIDFLSTRKPASLKVCVLLDKEESRKVPVNVDFVGVKVPRRFLVGFGLDYDEYYRNLPFVIAFKE